MELINNKLIESGILGIIVLTLSMLIYRMRKEHREDRNEWMQKTFKQNDKMINVIQTNTEAITSIKTILETVERHILRNKKNE